MDKKNIVHFLDDSLTTEHAHSHCPLKTGQCDLVESIMANGQLALIKGDLQIGLECFDEALNLDSNNAQIYYAQGLSLFEYSDKHGVVKFFLQASKKFKKAIALDPHHFDFWQAWASVLCKLGVCYNKQHYFQDALEKMLRAIDLSSKQSNDVLADLYWELGTIHAHLAHYSGEALDLHQAINAFHKVQSLQKHLAGEFWKDYGRACYKFAQQINDTRFYIKAISCLKNALSSPDPSQENWHLLADVFQALYFQTHDEDHFAQANECYETAMKLQPNNASLWFHWATFLCESSRKIYDLKRLRACVEKCQRAFSCDPDNLQIHAIWAEALAMLGSETERLDIIYEAQNRISQVIEISGHLPAALYSYGITLKALGRYFNDCDYYYQAIERFQEAISIDRTCHMHWHAIGNLYALLGEIEDDAEILERSFRFYQKAIDHYACTFYIIDYAIALYKLGEMTQEERWLEMAIAQFERGLHLQKNALYLHPNWLFYYACTLDALGDFHEEEAYYLRAIEIFSHVLMIDPDLHIAHHHLALAFSHLGELTNDTELFHRAIHHLRISSKHLEENDSIMLDWAITLINAAYYNKDASEADELYRDAEHKLWSAIQLGNAHAYYHLAGLYSLLNQCEKAIQCLYRGAHFDILPSIDEMLQDEWLDNLRSTGDFIEFLSQLEQPEN